ncbi:serine endopeptidase [Piscinibacterium candidicorallinum]|uniref:Serine endopeptidase n=1 Tax=Piscinibacterium candidicorallinum TaxID=1793872 RepID=A0ABV7H8U8_9BURK
MSKGIRLSEKWFRRGLWLVAVVFAGFLIGLGGLIVSDLPRVEERLQTDDYIDKAAAAPLRAQLDAFENQQRELSEQRERAQLALTTARNDVRETQDTFANWLATRGTTQKSDQDPEVIARTKALDGLKAKEREAQRVLEGIDAQLLGLTQQRSAVQRTLADLEYSANTLLAAERRKQELRVFAYRLALTLPLLLIAGWLFVKKRKGQYWPFVWGFIFFALFAFFVELVPYLPSYGGYVRYIVGIALTLIIGHYAIRAMQRYLERQKLAEAQPEVQRRESLSYDLAMARLAKKVCPGCERPVDLANPENNHCPHCGIGLFDRCGKCNTRKNAFARYCHACGEPAAHQVAAESA